MSFSAAQAGDDQLTVSQIDQELKCLTERCCHLKYLRNIYTPISHLPPELLLRILTIYKQQVENEHKESQSSSSPYAAWKHTYTWVLVSHVCRHWRNVTLSSPTFWSTIYMPSKLTSLDWVDELLQRSKSATLRILSLPLSIASGTEGIHLDHLSRFLCHDDTHALRPIRRLQLSLYAQREGDLPDCGGLPLFDSSAHNLGTLEHLEIMYDYSLYYGAQRLLSQLFAGRAPNVRSVCLSKWPWPDYSYQWRVPASPEMTWNEFRRAMTSFEHLQHLDLIGFLSHVKLNTNLGVSGRKEVVPLVLPQLRSLTLRDDWIEQYVEFFEALSIPLTTQVDVRPIMYEEDEVTVELFGNLSRGFSPSLGPTSNPTPPFSEPSSRCDVWELQSHAGVELGIFQSSESPVLGVSLDPHKRDDRMEGPDTYESQSINICTNKSNPHSLGSSQALFRGIAQHLQTLTSPNHRGLHHRYICHSYR